MLYGKDIYDKLVNKVLEKHLFEEQDQAGSPAENDPNWVAAKITWEKHVGKSFDSLTEAQRNTVSRKFLRPAAQTGYLVDPRNGQKIPIR